MSRTLRLLGLLVAICLIPAAASSAGGAPAVSPWAVAPSSGSSYNPQFWAKSISSAGVLGVRGIAQEGRGAYTIEKSAGLSSSGIFMWSPDGSALSFPVNDLAGWRDYIKTMMTRFPEVDHWEVWNEPPNFTQDTDPADYAKIVEVAYETAKSINPDVKVGLAGKATDIRWLGESIEAGAKEHFDYVTLHPYERAGMLVSTGGELSFMSIVPQVRAMLAATAPKQKNVPVRFTEIGVNLASTNRAVTGGVSYNTAADVLVKVYTMGIAQGAEQIAWFDPFDGDTDGALTTSYGLIARDGTKRPAFYAYSRLVKALGEHPDYLGWVKRRDGGLVFVFRGANKNNTVLVAWSSDANGATLPFTRLSTAINPRTGAISATHRLALTAAPMIINTTYGTARRWASLAAARRGLAFNSQTAAQSAGFKHSVSVSADSTFGGVGIMQGTKLTTIHGVRAYKVGQPAVGLAVSPSFSAWDSTKIQVTARVFGLRGNPGFNLKYDSSQPLSKVDWSGERLATGWQSVPVGKWTTLHWTIDDAAFVGMYGFTMRFDSDSTTYSGYAIRSITVTRTR